MPLKFTSKAAGAAGKPADKGSDNSPSNSTQKATSQPSSTGGNVPSFMMKGAKARNAIVQAEADAERRKQEAGKAWRFWLEKGTDASITFLDGKLDDEGMLDILMWHEHTLLVNGDYTNFVCTAEADQSQPCPICEKGDRPALVGALTILDHREYKIKNGDNAGKILKDTRKLFVCKRQTIQQLTALAKKRGGLTGCTFDVSRIGENAANVGSQFDFAHKFATRQEIKDKYGLEEDEAVMPLNYADEITYHSPEELIKLGVGKSQSGPGYSKGGKGSTASKASLSDEL